MAFSIYSLSDVKTTISHPALRDCVLSDEGGGRITISYAGDMSSHTTTATGDVVVNKLVAKNGSIALEVPVNSSADQWLRDWIKYIKNNQTNAFALGSMVLNDTAGGRVLSMTGVTPQKEPDENYDQTSGNRQYNLLFAEMTSN